MELYHITAFAKNDPCSRIGRQAQAQAQASGAGRGNPAAGSCAHTLWICDASSRVGLTARSPARPDYMTL